ncbi:MAG: DUF2273 domain-containing protein [Peptococcaceae bacterium]|nr:DUF2273 domain-containing protein [Peptococcaceae bacterium]
MSDKQTPWWDTDTRASNDAPWWDTDADAAPVESTSVHTSTDHLWWDPDDAPAPAAKSAPVERPTPAPTGPMLARLRSWVSTHPHTCIWMLLGLLCGIGILCFGFWKTFLVGALLACGYVIGSRADGNPRLEARIRRFKDRFIDDNPFMK